MKEISEVIWQTCKTYLLQQGKFLMLLWVFIAVVIGALLRRPQPDCSASPRCHRTDPGLQHRRYPG